MDRDSRLIFEGYVRGPATSGFGNPSKYISVWYNSYGTDVCYAEITGEWNQHTLDKFKGMVNFIRDDELVSNFDVEAEGDGWTMYEEDGIGIFVVDYGYDTTRAKEQYDETWDV